MIKYYLIALNQKIEPKELKMSDKSRKSIYLDESEWNFITSLSKRYKCSYSKVIRRLLNDYMFLEFLKHNDKNALEKYDKWLKSLDDVKAFYSNLENIPKLIEITTLEEDSERGN
jgi:hypothetical protein